MKIGRIAVLVTAIAGTTGLIAQRLKKEEPRSCECLGSQQPEEVKRETPEQSFSSVCYGAYVNPALISKYIGANNAKPASSDNPVRSNWESIRGPK